MDGRERDRVRVALETHLHVFERHAVVLRLARAHLAIEIEQRVRALARALRLFVEQLGEMPEIGVAPLAVGQAKRFAATSKASHSACSARMKPRVCQSC